MIPNLSMRVRRSSARIAIARLYRTTPRARNTMEMVLGLQRIRANANQDHNTQFLSLFASLVNTSPACSGMTSQSQTLCCPP